MSSVERPPAIVRGILRIESSEALDGPVQALEPHVKELFGSGTRGAVLRGDWLGQALHPMLTDVVLGSWTSATVLDVVGRGRWSAPAQSLIGVGLVAFGPTAWAGWAQWSLAGQREKRVGLVHAVNNALAVGVYSASWIARKRGHHDAGARLALLGVAVSSTAAYLGGHLAAARKVSSHHPAYDVPTH